MSKWLQMDANLTLKKAKKLMRQKEVVKEKHQQLQAGAGDDKSKQSPFLVERGKGWNPHEG